MQKHYCDNCKYEDLSRHQEPCKQCNNDPEDGEPTMWEEKEECQMLHNQLMELEKELLQIRAERDFWRNESMKWCDKSFEYRMKLEGGKQPCQK